jgi:spore coat polysaccharide biosynthesis predicted glycosyltransferase SpsG
VFLLEEHQAARDRIEAAGWPVEVLGLAPGQTGGAADLERVGKAASASGAATVVVDSYAVAAGFLAGLRASGLRVVAVDDLAREPLPAHLVVNGGVQAPGLPYRSATGDTQFLLGPAYAMLHPGFRDLPPRPIARDIHHVLVTVGGDDARNVTADLMGCLDRASGVFDVRVAVGPFSGGGDRVDQAARGSRRAVTVVRGAADLREFMLEADIAVSAAGQTLYELAAAGTPTIAFAVADNQAGSLRGLAGAGVVRSAGRASDPGFHDRLAALVDSLTSDAGARAGLSAAGQRLVDGRGAARVASAVVALR